MESHDVSIRTLQRHMEKEKVDHVLFCAFENDLITEKDFRDILDAEKQYKTVLFVERMQRGGRAGWLRSLCTVLQESAFPDNRRLGCSLQAGLPAVEQGHSLSSYGLGEQEHEISVRMDRMHRRHRKQGLGSVGKGESLLPYGLGEQEHEISGPPPLHDTLRYSTMLHEPVGMRHRIHHSGHLNEHEISGPQPLHGPLRYDGTPQRPVLQEQPPLSHRQEQDPLQKPVPKQRQPQPRAVDHSPSGTPGSFHVAVLDRQSLSQFIRIEEGRLPTVLKEQPPLPHRHEQDSLQKSVPKQRQLQPRAVDHNRSGTPGLRQEWSPLPHRRDQDQPLRPVPKKRQLQPRGADHNQSGTPGLRQEWSPLPHRRDQDQPLRPVPKKRQLQPSGADHNRSGTPDGHDDIAMRSEAKKAAAEFVKRLPRTDARALKKALKKGLKKIRHGRVIVIGPGRSGKTALIRSLLREIFKHTHSTIGMDIRKTRCFARSHQESIVFEMAQDQFQQKVRMAYNAIIDLIDKDLAKSPDPGRRAETERASPRHVERNTGADDPSLLSASEEVPDDVRISQNILEKFVEEMRKNKSFDEDVLEMIWHLDIWDFAGQKPFEVLQHMFLTSKRCAYIIVFDATKLITSRYKDEFCDSYGRNHDLDEEGCSYFTAFESWLNIVQQVVGDDISVPVYAVGTHIDEIPIAMREQELAKVEEFIWNSAEKRAYYQNVRKIFFVDNTLSGSDTEDPQMCKLRAELMDGIEHHCTVPIPVAWMPFAPAMDAIATSFSQPILPLERVCSIARHVCQDLEVDIDGLLSYHHQLGQIVPVHLQGHITTTQSALDSASDIVIDPDWMMVAASVLFCPQSPSGRAQEFRRAFELLFSDGVLTESLAIHRWQCHTATATLARNSHHRKVVFSLLQKFAMIYKTGVEVDDGTSSLSHKFLVPALVNRPFDLQPSMKYHVRTPPYYIVCGDGQSFPEVLFWCSVVRLMEQFKSIDQPLFYRRMARLLVENRYWLQLSLFDKGITMTMESEQQDDMRPLAGACNRVYERLSRELRGLSQVALSYLLLYQAVRCQCLMSRQCVEHSKRHCQEITCSHFAKLPLLEEDIRKLYGSEPPVFRCQEGGKPRAVVADQVEMKLYWLPSGSEMGKAPEEVRNLMLRERSTPAAPLTLEPSGRKTLLKSVKDLDGLGQKMAQFLNFAERDNFAKLAVEFNDEDINNYPSIIKDHIARHGRYQDAATTNVPAVLFYLVDKRDCTFGDLECLLKEASPRNALKVAGVLWNET